MKRLLILILVLAMVLNTGAFSFAIGDPSRFGDILISTEGTSPTIAKGNTSRNLAVAPDGTIYAVYHATEGIYVTKSVNDGASFSTPVLVTNVNSETEIAVSSSGIVYVLYGEDGTAKLKKSTDSAATFSDPVTIGSTQDSLGYGMGFTQYGHMTVDGNYVYIISGGGGKFYVSDDAGNSFVESTPSAQRYFADVHYDVTNNDVIIQTDNPLVYIVKSENRGSSFGTEYATGNSVSYSVGTIGSNSSGRYLITAGQGNTALKIDLDNNTTSSISVGNSTVSQGRSLSADAYGNLVTGYSDGTSVYFSVSQDIGESFGSAINVATSDMANASINTTNGDVMFLYEQSGQIYLKVYAGLLAGYNLNVSKSSLFFSVADNHLSEAVTLTNTSEDPLPIHNISVVGDFEVDDSTIGSQLLAGESKDITISYNSPGLGTFTGYIEISYGTDQSKKIYLQGYEGESLSDSTVPDPPTNVVATASNEAAIISFDAPGEDGGSAITGYTITSNPGAISVTTDSALDPVTITGLTNGTAYTFTVTASNGNGDSVASSASNAVKPSTIPDAPTNVVATSSNEAAIISFDPPGEDGGSAITGYTITSSPGAISVTADSALDPVTINGLTNGTAYTFTVTASNSNGDSVASSVSNAVTPSTIPGAPINVVATAGNSEATISFDPPANDGGSPIVEYTITSSPGAISVRTDLATDPITISGLTNGLEYSFIVTATNARGESIASLVSNTVTPSTVPNPPTNVFAVARNGRAIITFDAPTDNGGASITGYTITSSPDAISVDVDDPSAPVVISGLTNSTAYVFTVTATNIRGESNPSNVSNSVTLKAPDTPSPNPAPSEDDVIIIINGEEVSAGEEEIVTGDGGKTEVTITVDPAVVKAEIEAIKDDRESEENIIKIPVSTTDANQVTAKLTGDIVKEMEDNDFRLTVQTDSIDYSIPASDITIEKVADALAIPGDNLAAIEVDIVISNVNEELVAEIRQSADSADMEIVFAPVSFSVVARVTEANGNTSTLEIDKFTNYVERVLRIPEGVDPSRITTGVIYEDDGTISHIPTYVYEEDGIWYASINSLTNSAYSLIWHPIKVASVEGHWAEKAVTNMASRLVIEDTEHFNPEAAISRADFMTYLVKGLGIYRAGSDITSVYSDAKSNEDLGVRIGIDYGLVSGYPDGTFKPNEVITREEAMTIISKAMAITKLTPDKTGKIAAYTDLQDVSIWALESIENVVEAGVFVGETSSRLAPKASMTYAEAVQAIENLLILSNMINQ